MDFDPARLRALLAALDVRGYDFVPPTPATHARVLARRGPARDARDVFGWSRTFGDGVLDAELEALAAPVLVDCGDGTRRSLLRVARLGGRLFLHSAYPTDAPDAVFLGPDSYRFAGFIVEELRWRPAAGRFVDIGGGAGVGIAAAAGQIPGAALAMTDVNPSAVALARVNLGHAEVAVDARAGTGLADLDGDYDLALLNPPFIADDAQRAYRDGGERLGAQLSLDLATGAMARLTPGGRLLLYTGAAVIDGVDVLYHPLAEAADNAGCALAYREIDPDIFGEELDQPAYAAAGVERIALIGAVATRSA